MALPKPRNPIDVLIFHLEKIDDLSSMLRNIFLNSNISQFRVPNFFIGIVFLHRN